MITHGLAQDLHGFGDLVLDGFNRDAQLLRDFPMRKLLKTTEVKNDAAFFRQGIDGGMQRVLQGVLFFLLVLIADSGVWQISQVVGVVTTALMFLSPIFYPASALREPFRSVLQWNPLAIAIEQVREVLIRGNPPPFTELLTHTVVACFVAWLGFVWFQNTRKGFADVL